MKLPSLHLLLKIEFVLLVITILLYLATMNANDLSGLIVLLPIFGMAFVGFFALIVFITQNFSSQDETQTVKSKILKSIGLILFGLPVYGVLSNDLAATPLYGQSFLVFLIGFAIYIFINDKIGVLKKLYEVMLLFYPLILSIIYALDSEISTLPYFWITLGIGIFVIGIIKIFKRR